jgi:hypothetical protein
LHAASCCALRARHPVRLRRYETPEEIARKLWEQGWSFIGWHVRAQLHAAHRASTTRRRIAF